jgi:cob(I)alamin adenosyltransferase
MKIYTKTGDKGKTSLIGGTRVPKHHQRIEAYGTIDELMAHIGLLYDELSVTGVKSVMLEVQDRLMTCASILAADCEDCEVKIPEIIPEDIEFLEKLIDAYDQELEPLRTFVLFGGHAVASHCHIARTVCRRAERIVTRLSETMYVPDSVIQYLNRLSDYLFVLSRKILKDFNIDEIPWQPRL